MPTPVPNQVRVTHRLNRKTTVACFQGHRLRGQCKNQSVSKYDQEVRHLVGKARRKALQRLYERSRANLLPHAKPVGGARQIQHAVQVALLVKQAKPVRSSCEQTQHAGQVQDPAGCGADIVVADPPCEESESILVHDLRMALAQVEAQLTRAQEELAYQKRIVHWHEHVRDWVSSAGREVAVELASQGLAPAWVKFEGRDICQS